MKIEKTNHQGVYIILDKKEKYLTKNLTPGKKFFSEVNIEDYRIFDPNHSKLAAAIAKGIKNIPLKEKDVVLYLGASHGYTVSFVSDIVGKEGIIYAIEIAPRVIKDLVFLAEERANVFPILADANKPETYKNKITKANIIFQDISQKNQAEILLKNLQFLKKGGYVLLSIKSRSIDVTRPPEDVFKEVEKRLQSELELIEKKRLEPYEKDHCFYIYKTTRNS